MSHHEFGRQILRAVVTQGVNARPLEPTRTESMRSFLIVSDWVPRQCASGLRFMTELGRQSKAQGVRMGLLLAGEPIQAIAEAFRGEGIVWWTLPKWKVGNTDKERFWQFVSGFRRINAMEPWDVVAFEHCNPLSVITACTLSRIRDGRRFARVWHQHQGIRSPGMLKKHISTLRMLGPFMNAFAPLSELGAKSFVERGCDPAKIKIIHNGVRVPDEMPREKLRPTIGLKKSDRVLFTAASLIHRKGLDVMLAAVAPLCKEFSHVHLVIAGGGPLMGELQELSRRLQIESQVHFLGISNNVPEILPDCDIFVLSSRNEASPVAIMEAMASSLPVVATDVGYVRDVVVDGKTGLLVRSEDVPALTAALRRIVVDEKLGKDFGVQGRARIEQGFNLDQQAKDYLSLYRHVSTNK